MNTQFPNIDRLLNYCIDNEDWKDSPELISKTNNLNFFLETLYDNGIITFAQLNSLSNDIWGITIEAFTCSFRQGFALGCLLKNQSIETLNAMQLNK